MPDLAIWSKAYALVCPRPGHGREKRASNFPIRHPEIELLLCVARSSKSPETIDRIRAAGRQGIDWEYVLSIARVHGVEPLLHWQLGDVGPDVVPKRLLDHLRNRFQANQMRNLYLSGELLKLLSDLEARSIPVLPYKGPLLAAFAYGNVGLRWFGDLDILVREDDVPRATEVLAGLGYEAENGMTEAQEAAFMRYERQYAFARNSDGSVVEVHWKVAPWPVSFFLKSEHLWEETQGVALGGRTVPTLGPEVLLITLCVHGAAHLWERLGWICDVAEIVRVSADDLDWESLLKRATELNVRRMLLLGLSLAHELLAAELPEEVLRETRLDRQLKTLSQEVCSRLFSEDRPQEALEYGAGWRFHLRAMERLRDKVRYCVHRSTAPTLTDWEFLPLPTTLFPLYRVLRPVRLAARIGQRRAKNVRSRTTDQ